MEEGTKGGREGGREGVNEGGRREIKGWERQVRNPWSLGGWQSDIPRNGPNFLHH